MDFAQIASVNQPAPIRNKVEILILIIIIVVIKIVFSISLNWIYPCFKRVGCGTAMPITRLISADLFWQIGAFCRHLVYLGLIMIILVVIMIMMMMTMAKVRMIMMMMEEDVNFGDKAVSGRRRCYCCYWLLICG